MVVSLLLVEQSVTQTESHKWCFSAASGTASHTNKVTQMVFSLLQVEQPVTQTESHKWCFLCCKWNSLLHKHSHKWCFFCCSWSSQSHKQSHTNGGCSAASGRASHTNGVIQMVVALLQVEELVTQTESYKWWLLCCKWKS